MRTRARRPFIFPPISKMNQQPFLASEREARSFGNVEMRKCVVQDNTKIKALQPSDQNVPEACQKSFSKTISKLA